MRVVRTFGSPFTSRTDGSTELTQHTGNLRDLHNGKTWFIEAEPNNQLSLPDGHTVNLGCALKASLNARDEATVNQDLGILAFNPTYVTAYWVAGEQRNISLLHEFNWNGARASRHRLRAGQSFTAQPYLIADCMHALARYATSVRHLVVWSASDLTLHPNCKTVSKPWTHLPPTADLDGALLLAQKR